MLDIFKYIFSATINQYDKHCCNIINAFLVSLKYFIETYTQQAYII